MLSAIILRRLPIIAIATLLLLVVPVVASAQTFDSSAFAGMRWREIGPYRGGRSVAVTGSSKRPLEYWMGTTGGGVFKTTDGGRTWKKVLYVDENTGANDIAWDLRNPQIYIFQVKGGEFTQVAP